MPIRPTRSGVARLAAHLEPAGANSVDAVRHAYALLYAGLIRQATTLA